MTPEPRMLVNAADASARQPTSLRNTAALPEVGHDPPATHRLDQSAADFGRVQLAGIRAARNPVPDGGNEAVERIAK